VQTNAGTKVWEVAKQGLGAKSDGWVAEIRHLLPVSEHTSSTYGGDGAIVELVAITTLKTA